MKGWPSLKPDLKVKSKLHCIKDKWFVFDETVPYAVMSYDGMQYSIAFFTRWDYLAMRAESRPPWAPNSSLEEAAWGANVVGASAIHKNCLGRQRRR